MSMNVIWEKYGDGIIIQDSTPEYHEMAVEFTVQHFKEDPMCHYLTMSDDIEALNSLKDFMRSILRLGTSLILLNTETNEIMGLALLFLLIFAEKVWVQIQLYAIHSKVRTMVNFDLYLVKKLREERIEQNLPLDSMHIFDIKVASKYKGHNWKLKLLMCCYRMTQSMKIPYMTMNAYTVNDQNRARSLGMEKKYQIYYGYYQDLDGNYTFHNIKKEYFCISFQQYVTPPVPYYKLPPEIKASKKR